MDTDRVRAELGELARKAKRIIDKQINKKRLVIAVLLLIFVFLYLGPKLLDLFLGDGSSRGADPAVVCLEEKLALYEDRLAAGEVRFESVVGPNASPPVGYSVPYIGNGRIGLALDRERDARLRVKGAGRGLSSPVDFAPLVSATLPQERVEEKFVVDLVAGKVKHLQCSRRGVYLESVRYAHRTLPSLLVQEFAVHNPLARAVEVELRFAGAVGWNSVEWRTTDVAGSRCEVSSGPVLLGGEADRRGEALTLSVAIVVRAPPPSIVVKARETTRLRVLSAVAYGEPAPRAEVAKRRQETERLAEAEMKRALEAETRGADELAEEHERAWRALWETGLAISESKATAALNGDRINATLYAAFSQARSLDRERGADPERKREALRSLDSPEGCYMGHPTLLAGALWPATPDAAALDSLVETWLLTLEKKGCRELLRAGAAGLAQAIVLSFGGFRFADRHLEFDIHPSELHRDFLFRRIRFGEATRLNVSVVVGEDDKATLFAALDRSEGELYACDGGCLDGPVRLGAARTAFPVKLTDPPTAVLYVSADRVHLEDLRRAIHVKEVALAPAHEHRVIALHRHGHGFGGLSTLFWVSVCILIVLFHVFLCRLIVTEFCDNGDRYRRLYSKP